MDMKEYVVIGYFRQPHKDCEAVWRYCDSYDSALLLKEKWKKERKYKEVYIEIFKE